MASMDNVAGTGVVSNIGDTDMLEDQIDCMLVVVDGGLDALSPSVRTARELSDGQRKLCELGLKISKRVLNELKSLQFFWLGHAHYPFLPEMAHG